MTKLPDWDFFHAYRTYGGWETVVPYLHVVEVQGATFLVKSHAPIAPGKTIRFKLMAEGHIHVRRGSGYREATSGEVQHTISKKEFESFNFATATPIQVRALGEFMCGVMLHGQWFGELFLQMAAIAQQGRP